MPRPAITPQQRIEQYFADLKVPEQREMLDRLEEWHRFSVRRDSRSARRNGQQHATAPLFEEAAE